MTKREQLKIELIRRIHGFVGAADVEKTRQSQEQLGSILGNSKEIEYKEVTVAAINGEWISVRRPHDKKKIILYCHGGGFSTGSRKYSRTVTAKLALSASMDVFSFDYRLAPEHPYPAALEDAVEVWNYLMLMGYGADDIIVAGDSAGGNLALALVFKLKEEGRRLPKGVVLLSPWTDMTHSGQSITKRADMDPVLNLTYLYKMRDSYATGQDFENPYISPLFGEFEKFPPTYIQVGENEILYSDSLRLYKRMIEANAFVKIDKFEGMCHVFQMMPTKMAREAVGMIAEFIYEICR